MRIHNQENTEKIVGAPEFWCPFKLTTDFFVLISKMDFSNINLSIFPSVFMCSAHLLFLFENCQHKWEYTIKKTTKKYVGALKFWCPGTSVISPSRKPQKIVLVPGHQNSGAHNVHDWLISQIIILSENIIHRTAKARENNNRVVSRGKKAELAEKRRQNLRAATATWNEYQDGLYYQYFLKLKAAYFVKS